MVIGIDLGTTFSLAAYVDSNGVPKVIPNRDGTNTLPSVVMFDCGEAVVGIQAKNNAVTSPYNVAQFAKRHIGDDFEFSILDDDENESLYSPEEVSAIILKRLKEDCEQSLGKEITSAVITVPAYFSDAQKNSTIAAGKIAGLNVLKVIHEPTAAAMAYGLDKLGERGKVLIYDLGGGTFDVTLAELNGKEITVLASHGNKNLGGFDFDNALIEYATEEIMKAINVDAGEDPEDLQLLRQRCEEAKIALSTRDKFDFTIKLKGKKAKVEVTRDKFESLIMSIIDTTGVSIDIVLDESGINIGEVDKVLLVGGSSIIPAVKKYIVDKLGIQPSSEVNPHEVVAIGAAICAAGLIDPVPPPTPNPSEPKPNFESIPTSNHTPFTLKDRNSHGFGVIINGDDDREINSVIITRNQPLLQKFTKVYSTVVDEQESIFLRVTEGEDENLKYVSEIGTTEIELTPHPAHSPIAVEFMYDDNGIIAGRVFDLFDVNYETDDRNYLIGDISDLHTAKFIGEISIKRARFFDDEEIAEKRSNINSLTIQ